MSFAERFWFDDVVPGLDWADDVTRLELRNQMARQLSGMTTDDDDDDWADTITQQDMADIEWFQDDVSSDDDFDVAPPLQGESRASQDDSLHWPRCHLLKLHIVTGL